MVTSLRGGVEEVGHRGLDLRRYIFTHFFHSIQASLAASWQPQGEMLGSTLLQTVVFLPHLTHGAQYREATSPQEGTHKTMSQRKPF